MVLEMDPSLQVAEYSVKKTYHKMCTTTIGRSLAYEKMVKALHVVAVRAPLHMQAVSRSRRYLARRLEA